MHRGGIILLALVLVVAGILASCGAPTDGTAEGTAEVHFYQGNKLDSQGRYDEAIEEFTKAIELNPNMANAYFNRGNSYGKLGQFERAIQDYDEVISLNPQDASAYINRGNCYDKLGQLEQAIKNFDEAIRLDPDHAVASRASSPLIS
jgi:tetratricopeptide (TPR) repeat protein